MLIDDLEIQLRAEIARLQHYMNDKGAAMGRIPSATRELGIAQKQVAAIT